MILGGLIIGLIYGWLFTLIIIGLSPIMFLSMCLFMNYEAKRVDVFKDSYAKAGGVSDETFTFIKTVKSLNGEPH